MKDHKGSGSNCFDLTPDDMCDACRQTLGYPPKLRCVKCGKRLDEGKDTICEMPNGAILCKPCSDAI